MRRVYIEISKARSIESYQALKRYVLSIELAVEDLTRGFLNNKARWIKVAIKETESFSMDRTSH